MVSRVIPGIPSNPVSKLYMIFMLRSLITATVMASVKLSLSYVLNNCIPASKCLFSIFMSVMFGEESMMSRISMDAFASFFFLTNVTISSRM